MNRRTVISLVLFATALFSLVGFMLHMIIFTAAYDLSFLFHRAALSTTTILCVFCGLCTILNLANTDAIRFENRFLFANLFLLLILFLFGTCLALFVIWIVGDSIDGVLIEDILDGKMMMLFIILVFGIATTVFLIVVILLFMTMCKKWGSVGEDD